MIKTATFSWKSVIKGSCTAEEFRVILEKEKSDRKVFLIVHKKYSRYSVLSEYFPLHPKNSLVIAELVPDLPGAV